MQQVKQTTLQVKFKLQWPLWACGWAAAREESWLLRWTGPRQALGVGVACAQLWMSPSRARDFSFPGYSETVRDSEREREREMERSGDPACVVLV